jgi:hypothetical protein
LALSDRSGDRIFATDESKDERIIEYLRDATSKDPNSVADWRFFLDSKGRSLSDPDLVRTYIFAVEFIDKWQDVRINVGVSYYSVHLPDTMTIEYVRLQVLHGCRVLQRHIYQALKRNPSWFVPVHQFVGLFRKVGPGGETPDALVVSHLAKGKKTGTVGLITLMQSAVDRRMHID